MMYENRMYYLPIFVETLDHAGFNQKFLMTEIKDPDAVMKFYEDKGIKIDHIEHISPSIGPEREEIVAYYPEGWSEVGAGGPWVDVLNEKGKVVFSMFVKKAPWDYSFFTRPRYQEKKKGKKAA